MSRPDVKFLVAAFVCLVILAASGGARAEEQLCFSAFPNEIRIGTFYHGTGVRITAEVPACDGAVLKIEGPDEEMVLNKKGKVTAIWLNVAKVTVNKAPRVYILAASGKLEDFCSAQERKDLRLGLEALKQRIVFESDKPLSGWEFDEFIKLKEHAGTYSFDTPVELGPVKDDKQKLTADLPIPSAMPPGQYTIQLMCFRNGNLAESGEVQLLIEKSGLPLFLTTLGFDHAAVYGVLAIVVAMLAGIIMGIIFSSRSGRAH
jgi:uncharacterized protein (TIGR02186 family)